MKGKSEKFHSLDPTAVDKFKNLDVGSGYEGAMTYQPLNEKFK